VHVKSYTFDIGKTLRNQKNYNGSWASVKFSKNSIDGNLILVTCSNLKFCIGVVRLMKRDKKIDYIV
jgi:hypothetical protein